MCLGISVCVCVCVCARVCLCCAFVVFSSVPYQIVCPSVCPPAVMRVGKVSDSPWVGALKKQSQVHPFFFSFSIIKYDFLHFLSS